MKTEGLTSGKPRFEDAEVQEKMPKMLPGELRNTLYYQMNFSGSTV